MDQGNLALSMGAMNMEKRSIDSALVARCKNEYEAMRLCIAMSRPRYTQDKIAELMGMNRGTLNTILNSDFNKKVRKLSIAESNRLQRICSNTAIWQWAEMEDKKLLDCQKEEYLSVMSLIDERKRIDEQIALMSDHVFK